MGGMSGDECVAVNRSCGEVSGGEFVFFFQAEDGIRDAQESRGLGDVYKRQVLAYLVVFGLPAVAIALLIRGIVSHFRIGCRLWFLSLIHI